MKSSRWENSFVFLTAALFFLYWAREFVSQTGFFAPEIVVRSGLASDLWADQISGRQGLLCSFWWPPLPTLLYLPPGWLPFPAKSFLPGLLITCLTGGLTAFFINRLAVRNEVPCWYRWLFLLLFCLHPWYRQIFSGTSSHGLLLTLLAATFYGFAGWSQERKIRYFLLLSISPALAIISSPAGIFLSVGVLLLLAVTSIRAGYPWRRQQAIMLLYLVPAVYCGGLWFLGNWIVMQDAGYFLRWVHWKNIFQEIFLSACGSCYHLTEAMLLLSAWMFGLLL
ncbi:MAG TPA: hypothetical protein PKX93_12280, partial [bacterium]|nr:hypothetical protein [bacterium]